MQARQAKCLLRRKREGGRERERGILVMNKIYSFCNSLNHPLAVTRDYTMLYS